MFWPARMYHVVLIFPRERKHELVLSLHEEGVCQLAETKMKLECLQTDGIDEVRELELKLRELIDFLGEYREPIPPENFIKSFFFPSEREKTVVELRSNEEIIQEVRKQTSILEEPIKKKRDELSKTTEEMRNLETKIKTLSLIPNIPTNLLKATENLDTITGMVSSESVSILHDAFSNMPVVCISEQTTEKKRFVAVFFPTEYGKEATQTLHEVGFEELDVPESPKTPKEQIADLRKQLIQLRSKEREITEELREESKKHYKELLLLQEEVSICRERLQALENMRGGRAFAVMEAWVPERDFNKFKELVESVSKEYYMEVSEEEEAPSLLDNWVAKPAELLTNLYSPPRYGHLDPTIFLFITFPFFFGFMLTDAIYGVLALLLALGVYFGAGKYNEGLRDFSGLMVVGGIFTAILGALMGSFLGDFIKDIGFGFVNAVKLVDPMKDVVLLIAVTVAIGVFHMTLGFVLGVIDNVKNKDYKKALSDQGVWLVFLTGVSLLLGNVLLGQEMFLFVGLGLIGLSVLMQMAFAYMENGLVSSLLSVFDFSGFVGDVFSYTRLMAMALGTAGIALAINFLVFLVWDMVFGFSKGIITSLGEKAALLLWFVIPGVLLLTAVSLYVFKKNKAATKALVGFTLFYLVILAVLSLTIYLFNLERYLLLAVPLAAVPAGVLLVVGHLFNMIMNGLGAFVHSLRLHFLEFFTKFYEGGGKLYQPFYATRKITEVKK